MAVLAYVVGAVYQDSDDLGRRGPATGSGAHPVDQAEPVRPDGMLVDVPPMGPARD
jgi:hypothetical protein